jgi:tetratricopeptide (TPR) repeat protein
MLSPLGRSAWNRGHNIKGYPKLYVNIIQPIYIGEERQLEIYKRSFEAYQDALNINPSSATTLFHYGSCLISCGEDTRRILSDSNEKFEMAENLIKKAIELQPEIYNEKF